MLPTISSNPLSSPRATSDLAPASRPPIQPAVARGPAPGFAGASSFTPAGASAARPQPASVPADQAKAYGTKVAQLSLYWPGKLQQIADFAGVNLGSSLNFATHDALQLANLIRADAPADKIMNRADRLLAEWDRKDDAIFNRIGRGAYQNGARAADQAATSLQNAGVTGAPVQAARQMGTVLRNLAREALPPGGGPIDLGRIQQMMAQAMSQYAQAANQDRAAHPEHSQALWDAGQALQGTMLHVLQTFSQLGATAQSMAQNRADLQRPAG